MENKGKKDIEVELDERIAEGEYANLVAINHYHTEFVLDFIKVLHGVPKAKVKSRVILTPQNVKSFAKALLDNIAKYEKVNGTISTDENANTNDDESISIPINFGPIGEA